MVAPRFFRLVVAAYPRATLPTFRGQSWPGTPELVRAVKEFAAEHEAGLPGRENLLEAMALKLMHQIVRCVLGIAQQARVAHRMDINQAVEFFHHNISRSVAVAELARAAHLSVSHFSRMFEQDLGLRPKPYMLKARLSHAKRLLLQGECNITEAALASGFASSAHFASAFRRMFGTTPTTYRSFLSERSILKRQRRI